MVVLGGSWQQLEMVKAVRGLGFQVLVLDKDAHAPARLTADSFIQVDISDVASCVDIALQLTPSAVVSTGTEWAVASLAAMTEALGLPGPSVAVASTLRDKELIHGLASRTGVAMPEFECASDSIGGAAAARHLGLPVVVKPVDSSGSRGVSLVTQTDDLPAALAEAFRWSRRGRLCIERYVGGIEFGCQVIVWPAGQVLSVWAHNDELLPPPLLGPVGHSMPLCAGVAEHLVELAIAKFVTGLPYFIGALNFDFIWTPDGIVLLEVGCRFGGGCLPQMISYYDGTLVPDLLLRLSLGWTPCMVPSTPQPVAARHIGSAVGGILTKLEIPASLGITEGLLSVEYHRTRGALVPAMTNAAAAVVTIYATGCTGDEARQNLSNIARQVRIETSGRQR